MSKPDEPNSQPQVSVDSVWIQIVPTVFKCTATQQPQPCRPPALLPPAPLPPETRSPSVIPALLGGDAAAGESTATGRRWSISRSSVTQVTRTGGWRPRRSARRRCDRRTKRDTQRDGARGRQRERRHGRGAQIHTPREAGSGRSAHSHAQSCRVRFAPE